MTGITFVCRQIDRAIDEGWQIGIHLNYAMEIAFVPIVTAPRLIGHVLDSETLVRRKRHVGQRPSSAFLDRELKNRVEFFLRNHEWLSPFLVIFVSNCAIISSKCESG